MDIQTRKLHFLQESLRYANTSILDKFEEILKREREKELEEAIKPMTLKQYEQRINNALEDVKYNRVKSARTLKKDLATWK